MVSNFLWVIFGIFILLFKLYKLNPKDAGALFFVAGSYVFEIIGTPVFLTALGYICADLGWSPVFIVGFPILGAIYGIYRLCTWKKFMEQVEERTINRLPKHRRDEYYEYKRKQDPNYVEDEDYYRDEDR